MKLRTFLIGRFGGSIMLNPCTESPSVKDYSTYVNPFIGAGGHGHTLPGAVVPHGMTQPSPDIRIDGWDTCSGCYYDDSMINDFLYIHVSGTGYCDYGDASLMSIVGKPQYLTTDPEGQKSAYASVFSRENETTEPGYCSVFLDTYQVKAEIMATKRGAIHRHTFPESVESGFIIDPDYSLQWQTNCEMEIEVISDTEICGHKKTTYRASDRYTDFYAKFSKPFVYTLITDSVTTGNGRRLPVCKAVLHFNTKKDEEVPVKVGASAVDIADARKNMESEIPEWGFDKVRKNVRTAWNNYLSKIDITTFDKEDKTIFYTALCHTVISPSLLTDVDGYYLGMDLEVHQGDTINPLYTVFSLWDTFRALHPPITIIDPSLNNQFINSPIRKYQEGGIYPMRDLVSNYTGTMIGYHAVPVIVDAYMKGHRNFDIHEAYKASLRVAEYDTIGTKCPGLVLPHLMPKAKYHKNVIGYISCDRGSESAAKALEYAHNDWCISIFTETMNGFENKVKYERFVRTYEFHFDKSTRFMRGLDPNGEWRIPFNPRTSTHHSDDYCEGTAWQWTWFVLYNVEGLVKLMGGEKAFVEKLDLLFAIDSSLDGEIIPADTNGPIGQYTYDDEPSHHVIHLYNYVNHLRRTQELVDGIYRSQYANNVDGLPGNEDYGQMPVWYISNLMGFYQVCLGRPVYSTERSAFDKAVTNLPNEKTSSIVVKNNSKSSKYIESVLPNGKPLDTPSSGHQDIVAGGIMEVKMTDHPTQWGSNNSPQ